MRVYVDDPDLLRDLCDFLSRQGCVCVEVAVDAAEILIPGAAPEAASAMLASEILLWRARNTGAALRVEANV